MGDTDWPTTSLNKDIRRSLFFFFAYQKQILGKYKIGLRHWASGLRRNKMFRSPVKSLMPISNEIFNGASHDAEAPLMLSGGQLVTGFDSS